MWSNCYVWAWQKQRQDGGVVVLERSQFGWWWHAKWTKDFRRFEEFVPAGPKRRRAVPPLWFRGRVKVTTWR